MTRDKLAEVSMMMIAHVGVAKSNAFMAIQEAKNKNFAEAEKLLEEANNELISGQGYHFEALQADAKEELGDFTVLFIHAEDQFITSQLMIDIAKELIDIHRKL